LLEECLKLREALNFQNTNDGELASFIAFAAEFPGNLVCLIDTYDTMESGFKNYQIVAQAMLNLKLKPKGLRLDSGDLAQLSM
jgi:nicotinate phosphoribosyltransferase